MLASPGRPYTEVMHITSSHPSDEGDVRHFHTPSALCDPRHTVEIRATRIGGHAYRYFAEKARSGRVVSIFRHGFNIVFDEADDPTWIVVQTPTVPLHPWAIEVPTVSGSVVVGTPAQVDDDSLILGLCSPHAPHATGYPLASPTVDFGPRTVHSALRARDCGPRTPDALLAIHALHATCHELRIAPYTSEEAARALSCLPLLERHVAEEGTRRPSDPFQARIDTILECWRATNDPAVSADLVGLGIGSTPSGDDCLVGLTAGLNALSSVFELAAGRLRLLRGWLTGDGKSVLSRTGTASRQAIEAALEGSCPEPLRLLLRDLGQRVDETRTCASARRVLALGVTSGASMLRGVCTAWRNLA